jgi:hypothetical protein
VILNSGRDIAMPDEPPSDGEVLLARVIGVIYLTLCSGFGGGWLLFWHRESIYVRLALVVALVAGLVSALFVVRHTDPTLRPIRWGLLWILLGFAIGYGPLFALAFVLNGTP